MDCQRHQRNFSQICNFLAIIIVLITAISGIGFHFGHYYSRKVDQLHNDMQVLLQQQRRTDIKINELEGKINGIIATNRQVKDEIGKLYEDKTGRADFALGSIGARIDHMIDGTENYGVSSVFGLSLCEGPRGPNLMIHTDSAPGNCWAFKGSTGGVVIRLFGKVLIDSVSIEHIPRKLSPTGLLINAPKDFTVWGLKDATKKDRQLGQFSYNINGPSVQVFSVHSINTSYEYIELKFLSNHGDPDFTCVYRFRVHGKLMEKPRSRKS